MGIRRWQVKPGWYLRLIAAGCPSLLAVALAFVLWAMLTEPWDAWGFANFLVLGYVGYPLMFASVPFGLIGLTCAWIARRRERWHGVLPMLLIMLNLIAIVGGAGFLLHRRHEATVRRAYHQQNARWSAAAQYAIDFAEQHGGRFPDNVIELLNIKYLPEKIDLPNWGRTDNIRSMDRMPAADRQVILDWLRDNHGLIYLGQGLTLDTLDLTTADRIVLYIERDHVSEHGYQVTMLDGSTSFVDRTGVQAALRRSNLARAEADLPTHGEVAVVKRLR